MSHHTFWAGEIANVEVTQHDDELQITLVNPDDPPVRHNTYIKLPVTDNLKAAFRAIVAEWDKAEGIAKEAEVWPISVEADGRWFYVACTTHGNIGREGSPSEAAIMGSKHLYALHSEIVGVGI